MMRNATLAAALAAGALFASSAQGVSEIEFDLNAINAEAVGSGAFDSSFTGSIDLSGGALAGLLVDGVSPSPLPALGSLTGSILLDNGGVTGGGFQLTLDNGDTYDASIVSGVGGVTGVNIDGDPAFDLFEVDGLTFDGFFSDFSGDGDFGGLGLTDLVATRTTLSGAFLQFGFTPDANNIDDNANMEITVIIPLPMGAGLGLAGLAGLAARRRRALA